MDKSIKAEPNGLSMASLVFGIITIISSFTLVSVPFFASLTVTFALLSRGSKKMCTQAVVGVTLAVAAIFVGVFLSAAVLTYFCRGIGNMHMWLPW